MNRDYTDEKLEELKRQIFTITESEFSPIVDFLGDLWSYCKSWIGFLNIENYLGNVSQYHREVLDQHNTKVSELEEIFEEVRCVDVDYSSKLNDVVATVTLYNEFIGKLAETISPSTGEFSSKAISTLNDRYSTALLEAAEALSFVFDQSLGQLESKYAAKAAKEVVLDVLSEAKYIFSFAASVASGNMVAAAADAWNIINQVFVIGEDLVALAIIPIGALLGLILDDSVRLQAIDDSKDFSDKIGLPSELEDVPYVGKGVKVLDTSAKVVSLVNSIKGFIGDAGEFGDVMTSDVLTNETKLAYLKDVIKKSLGFSNTDYYSGSPKGWIKNNKGRFSNIKNIFDWLFSIQDGEVVEEIIDNWDISGIGDKWNDILKDVFEYIDEIRQAI